MEVVNQGLGSWGQPRNPQRPRAKTQPRGQVQPLRERILALACGPWKPGNGAQVLGPGVLIIIVSENSSPKVAHHSSDLNM